MSFSVKQYISTTRGFIPGAKVDRSMLVEQTDGSFEKAFLDVHDSACKWITITYGRPIMISEDSYILALHNSCRPKFVKVSELTNQDYLLRRKFVHRSLTAYDYVNVYKSFLYGYVLNTTDSTRLKIPSELEDWVIENEKILGNTFVVSNTWGKSMPVENSSLSEFMSNSQELSVDVPSFKVLFSKVRALAFFYGYLLANEREQLESILLKAASKPLPFSFHTDPSFSTFFSNVLEYVGIPFIFRNHSFQIVSDLFFSSLRWYEVQLQWLLSIKVKHPIIEFIAKMSEYWNVHGKHKVKVNKEIVSSFIDKLLELCRSSDEKINRNLLQNKDSFRPYSIADFLDATNNSDNVKLLNKNLPQFAYTFYRDYIYTKIENISTATGPVVKVQVPKTGVYLISNYVVSDEINK